MEGVLFHTQIFVVLLRRSNGDILCLHLVGSGSDNRDGDDIEVKIVQ
jgi:hypothetical protein